MSTSSRRYRLLRTILVLAVIAATQRGAGAADISNRVDWPKFLARHDLLWNRAPQTWGEGAFTGNGLLGTMIYLSDDKSALRFRVGRSDVMVQGVPQPHRLPIGDLLLVPIGKITGMEMRLDLWNAQVTGSLKTDKGAIDFKAFTHADELVQVIELKPEGFETGCSWRFEPGLAVNPRVVRDARDKKQPVPDDAKNPDPIVAEGAVTQPLRNGSEFTTVWREQRRELDDGTRTLFHTIGFDLTGKQSRQQATQLIDKATAAGSAALEQSHREYWHNFYPASFLSVPDTRLESFYWIQLYKLASATRADRMPIDLMGPWYNDTPWPRIWWNLNIQLTYYPIYAANHLELGEPFCRMIDQGAPNLAKNAGEFAEDSETISRTSGYDCVGGNPYEICNLPWAMHNYYMQYRHSMDDAMLRDRLLPRLKRAMNYYFHFMEERDGKLHLTRGHSPEYPDQPRVNPDCNIDLGLIRWGCGTLLESCERLKIDDPLIPKWKDTLARLTPYPTNENGLMVSASIPWVKSHRHYSHLLMIYPLYVMNWEQPESRPLIERSLDHWLTDPSAFRGYSWTGASSMSAMMGRREAAVKHLNHFINAQGRYAAQPNTHYQEAGPVIETPLSAARSLQDIVLTSWGNTIRILPGVPDAWPDVTIDRMRAEGAFLVSAARRGGKTQWVRIESLAGEPCRVKTDIPDVQADREIKKVDDGVVEVALKKGHSFVLFPRGQQPELVVEPVAAEEGKSNTFGLR